MKIVMSLSSNALYLRHLLPSNRLSSVLVAPHRLLLLYKGRPIPASCTSKYRKNHSCGMTWSLSQGNSPQYFPSVPLGGTKLSRSNSTVSANGGVSSSLSQGKKRARKTFIPIKAAINVTPKAREYLKLLIANSPKERTKGIMINYEQGSDGSPRMVFTFNFVAEDYVVNSLDEAVSLEVLSDGITPKPPKDAIGDRLPKLYINQHCVLKVLGSTVDVDDQYNIVLRDSEGNIIDPNSA